MEWNAMILLAFGVGLGLGAVAAGLLQRRSGKADRERAEQIGIELDEAREELESQRAEIAKHFEETSDLFRDLTEQYTRLYAHLSEGAREFCSDEVTALGRGFDGPLLGGSDDSEPAERPPASEAQTDRASAGSSQAMD
jgi:uncharacterized membrane-anchored protein YhcB (DUF1043 family)